MDEAGASLMVHIPQRGDLTDAQVARLAELKVPFITTSRMIIATTRLAQNGPSEFERATVDPEQLVQVLANELGFAAAI